MNSIQKAMFRLGGKLNVAIYRASGGRLMNRATGGSPVLLLTVKGSKSGTPFTTPVAYLADEGGYVVVGSAGGAPQEPQWFRNLRAMETHVRIGSEDQEVSVRVPQGAERDRLFEQVVAAYPGFGDYERKSDGRLMPVAVLTPR